MSKGILVVVSGFSGSGKGTVMKRLMEKYDNYALSVSVTTRNPRPGEKDGEEISDNYTKILKDIERVLGMEEIDVNSLFTDR